jgi:hypothetical protein
MSAVVLETCWGDNVKYILQNKKLGASSWSQELIYIMMHGQRNIKKLIDQFIFLLNMYIFPFHFHIMKLIQTFNQ